MLISSPPSAATEDRGNSPQFRKISPSFLLRHHLTVSQNLRQVTKVAVKQLADAFVVLQSEVVVVTVWRGQVDEAVQREGEAVSAQEVRGGEGREVKVGHVPEAGERIATQQRFCVPT